MRGRRQRLCCQAVSKNAWPIRLRCQVSQNSKMQRGIEGADPTQLSLGRRDIYHGIGHLPAVWCAVQVGRSALVGQPGNRFRTLQTWIMIWKMCVHNHDALR